MISDGIFQRERVLLGEDNFQKLRRARVLVVGVGGVGGYALEMLARSGVGHLSWVDGDRVEASNINRQIIALGSTVGKSKAVLWQERLRDINPDGDWEGTDRFLRTGEIGSFLEGKDWDAVVDAIDDVPVKVELLTLLWKRRTPVISAMGAGGKWRLGDIQVRDIGKTSGCPLARAVRTGLRKNGIVSGIPCVFSPEVPDCRAQGGILGSFSIIPAVFGCRAAAWVIEYLLESGNHA